MKLKVLSADARTIQTDKGLTFGAEKHPQMFKSVNGFRVPNYKKGDEIEIPEEAICTSDGGRQYVISAEVSVEQLQKAEIKLGIALKKKQILAS